MKNNNKGETLIETLVSLVVITIVIVGFTTVVTTMAKVNAEIRKSRVAFDDVKRENATTGWNITISPDSPSEAGSAYVLDGTRGVVWKDTQEGLVYYEYK